MMDDRNVNLELMAFIERKILPQYANFDKSHQLAHVNNVIRNSLIIAHKVGVDLNMAYTIAAYHDIGLSGPRAIHHLTSGKILMADQRLRKWFNEQQILIMKEAVEDHRASASHAPRSIYGKIVAEADRDLNPETVFRRCIQFGLANFPDADYEKQWKEFLAHMREKYSEEGYIRLWIQGSPNEEKLREVRRQIADKTTLRATFDRIYNEETKQEANKHS